MIWRKFIVACLAAFILLWWATAFFSEDNTTYVKGPLPPMPQMGGADYKPPRTLPRYEDENPELREALDELKDAFRKVPRP
jgi:hypothetical protein